MAASGDLPYVRTAVDKYACARLDKWPQNGSGAVIYVRVHLVSMTHITGAFTTRVRVLFGGVQQETDHAHHFARADYNRNY